MTEDMHEERLQAVEAFGDSFVSLYLDCRNDCLRYLFLLYVLIKEQSFCNQPDECENGLAKSSVHNITQISQNAAKEMQQTKTNLDRLILGEKKKMYSCMESLGHMKPLSIVLLAFI